MNADERTFRLWRTRNVLALLTILLLQLGVQRSSGLLVGWALWLLAFSLGLWLLGRVQIRRIEILRRIPPGAFEEEQVSVELLIANRSWFPAYLVEVGDRFPPSEVSFKRILLSEPLEAGAVVVTGYTGHCFKRRGRYSVGPLYVQLSDPLGLFTHRRPVPRHAEFLIYPGTIEVGLAVGGESRFQAARLISARHAGSSPSIHGVREFRTGDERRMVHWPSTARRGRLIVKELDREVARHLSILLDLEAAQLAGLGQKSTLEYAVKLAASLARRALTDRGLVQLFGAGAEELYVPPGTGQRHLLRCLAALVEVKQDGATPFTELLGMHAPRLPRGSTVALIFSGLEPDRVALAEALAICQARRIGVLAIVLDQRSFLQLREMTTASRARQASDLADFLAQWATVFVVRAAGELAPQLRAPWIPGDDDLGVAVPAAAEPGAVEPPAEAGA